MALANRHAHWWNDRRHRRGRASSVVRTCKSDSEREYDLAAGWSWRSRIGRRGKRPHLPTITNKFNVRKRVCRGSDPRHLRLTMDRLLDWHMWGATPCIKDHPVARLDLPSMS